MLSFGLTLLKLWAALKQALTDDDTKSLLVTNIARGYMDYKQERAKKSSEKKSADRSTIDL